MVAPTFESARVCVQRRVPRVPQMELHNLDDIRVLPVTVDLPVEFDYEVVAWPPGTVDGGLLPHNGDILTLPGYETPFRVIDRALHWPPPTSPEARRGEIRVDLIVEEAETQIQSPFGRPGAEQIQAEGRWLAGTVARFETRNSRELDEQGRPRRQFMSIAFDIPGVGRLSYFVTFAWQASAMFPGHDWGQHHRAPADQAALAYCLRLGQEFEVNVAPDQLSTGAGRLSIQAVRPPQRLEPGEEPNTWDHEANEITDEAWGGGPQ